ncbi:MAG: RagB/SusD family nutrient uptake outer membrane protein, partial [Verrucomicrobiaceae bacterium]
GVREGRDVDNKYKLFPIPTTDLVLNPNLKQNAGY